MISVKHFNAAHDHREGEKKKRWKKNENQLIRAHANHTYSKLNFILNTINQSFCYLLERPIIALFVSNIEHWCLLGFHEWNKTKKERKRIQHRNSKKVIKIKWASKWNGHAKNTKTKKSYNNNNNKINVAN